MKKLFIIPIIALLTSCENKPYYKIIESKYYSDGLSGFMPDGICRYTYRMYDNSSLSETQEKCDCYNVGDTIK